MSARARVLAVLAVAVAATGGCGGGDRAAFRDERLQPLSERLEHGRAEVAAALRTTRRGSAADARVLRSAVVAVDAEVQRVAALDAPDGVENEFTRYVEALRSLTARLARFAGALERGDRGAIAARATAARDAAGALARAERALARALGGD